MLKYFIIVFLLFSGLDPVSFLLGSSNVPPAADYAVMLVFGVLIPLYYTGRRPANLGYLRIPVVLILCVVVLRFVLDLGVEPSIARGPMRIHLVFGSFYLAYFVLQKHIDPGVVQEVIQYFIGVASAVSIINLLQVLLPDWPLMSNSRSYTLSGGEVGETFIRFQTTYYHFSTLAVVLLISLIVQTERLIGSRIWYSMLIVLNFSTVVISGYRANMYALIFSVGCYLVLFFRLLHKRSRLWIAFASFPLVMVVYQYTVVRDAETRTMEGENSSIEYRFFEAVLGLDKLESTNGWLFGVGYSDGFINPLAPELGQETYYLHNGYVSILYNYGIVGCVVWLLFIGSILKFIGVHYRAHRRDGVFILLSLHICGQLAQNVSSGIFNREPSATFAFILAFALLETRVRSTVQDSNCPPIGQRNSRRRVTESHFA